MGWVDVYVTMGPSATPNAWLPLSDSAQIYQGEFPFVKASLVAIPQVKTFFVDEKKVGLRPPNKVDAVIRCILPKFESGNSFFIPEEYERDLKIISASIENATAQETSRLIEQLKKVKFLACVPAGDVHSSKVELKRPGDNNIFKKSHELEVWFAGNISDEAWFPHEHLDRLLSGEIKGKLGYANASLIVKRKIERVGCYRKGEGDFDAGADIYGLEWALSNHQEQRAIFLWKSLLQHQNLIHGKELRSWNAQYPADKTKPYIGFSILGEQCNKHSWISGKDNILCRPTEIFLNDLPEGYEKDSARAETVSRLLGMRQPEREQALEFITEGDVRLKALIEHYQHSPDAEREKILKLIPVEQPPGVFDSFQEELEKLGRHQDDPGEDNYWPPGGVQNPGGYQVNLDGKTKSDVNGGKTQPRMTQFRLVRVQSANIDARTFLYDQYAGQCQVTGETFVKANGKNYFVAVNLVSRADAEHLNRAGNMLCLSAETAAKFLYGSLKWSNDDLKRKIQEFKAEKDGGAIEHRQLRIQLVGQEETITWTEQHFMRLISLWRHV